MGIGASAKTGCAARLLKQWLRSTASRTALADLADLARGSRASMANTAGAGLMLLAAIAHGAQEPIALDKVPEQLKPWADWVQHDRPKPPCPGVSLDPGATECIWPSGVEVSLTSKGGQFSLSVDTFAEGVVFLPGDAETWPREVLLGTAPVPVVPVGGRPSVRVAAGHHVLNGRFEWTELPLHLTVPGEAAKLQVTLDGSPFAGLPDAQGRLWLRTKPVEQGAVDSMTVRTFRQFVDQVPMVSTARFELSVSGQQREVVIPMAIFEGFVPLSIESPLPARVEADGSLKLQARAGTWVVTVSSRRMSLASELRLPESAQQEVWSFQADNAIRVVTLEGPPAVDPASVGAPAQWAGLPTFVLQPGGELKISQTQRGDSGATADRLSIQRTWWLDFDGRGFSVKDQITGSIGRTWRLDLPEQFTLGRVSVNGIDQPVTQNGSGRGVELREAAVSLEADSRIESAGGEIPASGWSAKFNSWNTVLNLPPGWRLLHASGVDSVRGAWLTSWTLWDIFAVLLISAVTFRVFGPVTAALLFAGLVLTWQMGDAPKSIWLALVVLKALANSLPEATRLRGWASRGAMLSALLIVIILVPFAVGQIRQAMYPALAMNYTQALGSYQAGSLRPQAPAAAPPVPAEAEIGRRAARKAFDASKQMEDSLASSAESKGRDEQQMQRRYNAIDPNVKIQTGPGIPTWQWATAQLSVQGPISPQHSLSLALLSPAGSATWSVASVILLFLALARCWGIDARAVAGRVRGALGSTAAVVFVVAFVGLGADQAHAQSGAFPPNELLQQLRDRLLPPPQPAECLPVCADLAQLDLHAVGDEILLRLEIHAQARVPVPLPSPGASIRPNSILANGKSPALRRDGSGQIWMVAEKGLTRVDIQISARERTDVPLQLPMAPRRVTSTLNKWGLAGIDARGRASGALTLSRVRDADKVEQEQEFSGGADLPPFVEIDRELSLGQTWTVHTVLRREGPSTLPMSVRIPLLPGERVTDQSVKVSDGAATVELAPGSSRSFSSILEASSKLSLPASTQPGQIERWAVTATPLWHIESGGLAPSDWTEGNAWRPRWLLWPGESVELSLTRPSPVEGPTLTIDGVQLNTTAGQRSSESSAELNLRSSTGGNHVFGLPPGAELLSVAVDGITQPLRAEKERLAVPIAPGAHTVRLDWRDPSAVERTYAAPRLDLGAPAVNATVAVAVPRDRVVLFVGGPLVGPAVLLWGVLAIVVLIAIALSRALQTPLGTAGWVLLGIGLTQASVISALAVVAWFVLFAVRAKRFESSTWRFNFFQVVLVLSTLVAASALLSALQQGLLGYPDMLITGNGSNAFNLRWYLDRTGGMTPAANFVSIPVFAYRLLMLAWALWLAISVTRWARWAWTNYSSGGAYWRSIEWGISFKKWSPRAKKEAAQASADQGPL